MKINSLFFFLLLFCPIIFSVSAQENGYIQEYIERLENSRKYLIMVAEAMPEDKYDFKVTEESMSFAQNLLHIGYAMDWHSQSLLGGRKARNWQTDTAFKVNGKSKKEMIAKIEDTFNETFKLIKQFDPNDFEDELDYF